MCRDDDLVLPLLPPLSVAAAHRGNCKWNGRYRTQVSTISRWSCHLTLCVWILCVAFLAHRQVSTRIPNPYHTVAAYDRVTSRYLYWQDYLFILEWNEYFTYYKKTRVAVLNEWLSCNLCEKIHLSRFKAIRNCCTFVQPRHRHVIKLSLKPVLQNSEPSKCWLSGQTYPNDELKNAGQGFHLDTQTLHYVVLGTGCNDILIRSQWSSIYISYSSYLAVILPIATNDERWCWLRIFP